MRRKWTPSKTRAREFAQQMTEIADFCFVNNISQSASGDSYYFTVDGQRYRVSNHSVESSRYHDGREADVRYIHAGKTRIIEIYTALTAGKELDGRGNEI